MNSSISELLTALAKAHPDRALIVVLPAKATADDASVEGEARVQTVLFQEQDVPAKGSVNLRIRAQSTLHLSRLSFYGSTETDSLRIQSMWVGDEPIFTDELGVPISRFVDEHLAALVETWTLNAGTDLMLVAHADVPAKLVVNLIALKSRPAWRRSEKHEAD